MKQDTNEQLESMMKRPIPRRKVGIIRLQMVKEPGSLYGMKRLNTPVDAVQMVSPLFRFSDREMVLVVSMNARLEPMAAEIASVGGLDGCPVDLRTLFKHALLNNAMGIMCFHNHPSGDPEPSQEDLRVTERIARAGDLLGIRLLDHIILGDTGYFSMKDAGMLPNSPKEPAA